MLKESEENLLLTDSLYAEQKEYWVTKLSADIVKTEFLPFVGKDMASQKRVEKIEIPLPDDLCARLMNLSYNEELTIFIILLAAIKVLIYRYTNNRDITVLSPLYKSNVTENTLNDCLFLRDEIKESMTFKELLFHVRETVLDAYENQDYPSFRLLEDLFDTSQMQDRHSISTIGCLLKNIHSDECLAEIEDKLFFSFVKEDHQLKGDILYAPNHYPGYYMAKVPIHLVGLLKSALQDVDTKVSDISFLSESEKRELCCDFNNNKADFSKDKTIVQLIENQSLKHSARTALSFEGNHVTFGHLNESANHLTGQLQEKGIGEDQLVGVLLNRSPLMMESILAVWKAGGAYIPLDISYPVQRVVDIMDDSGAGVLLTQSDYVDFDLKERYKGTIIDLDKETQGRPSWQHLTNLERKINMANLAFVIYTSGSTGKPKGVMVEHIGMMNHSQAKINDLGLSSQSIVAQNASHTFDISVWQFFSALTLGGKTVICPDELILEPENFISRLIDERITILEVVPSYLSVMLDTAGDMNAPLPLDYLLVTGEELKPNLVSRWFKKYPYIPMVNAYGPTEASDDITHHIMDKEPGLERIPIGKSLQNLNIYIVDDNMNLCPVGVKGEICAAGIGVGRGYLNDVKRTKRAFMEDPFARERGGRLYKTGDLGCWLPDGTIEFFGRKDYQVKIRGYRIELGEIENKLIDHAKVRGAVVIEKTDDSGNKFLCAYLVTRGECNVFEIKEYLKKYLPDYMVPTHFVELEELPLTPNGKIDRKALPEPLVGSHSPIIYISEEALKQVVVKPAEKYNRGDQLEEEVIEKGVLSEKERDQLLYNFNDTKVGYPGEKSLQQLFEEQVEKCSENIAIVYKGKTLTYRQLNEKTNQLARLLRSKGVKPDNIVGVLTEPSLELMIALLGVLKAGGGYMPIEPEYPDERIRFMLMDSSAQILLTQKHLADRVSFAGDVIILDNPGVYRGENSNLENLNAPGDVLHMLYTSGTTGKPKGVVISHRNLVNYSTWFSSAIRITREDKTLLNSSFAYDLCYSSLYSSVLSGGELHILPVEVYQSSEDMINYIRDNRITFIKLTPSHYSIIINNPYFNPEMFETIRLVVSCGEEIKVKDIEKTHKLCGHIEIMNHYGPSECTTGSITQFIDFKRFEQYKKFPTIGQPVYNTQAYILDKNLNLLPIGVMGELCISGDGMSRGYLNRPDLTGEKFVTHPYQPGKKLYRTGDFARWTSDGTIHYFGRIDHQVKLKGYRIELHEIESRLLKYRDIKQAVLMVREYSGGDKYLCAFLVSERILMEAEVREHLARELPYYMIPSYFVQLEKMPLNPNGKVDRNILKAVDINPKEGFKAPQNETENKLAEIWEEVLQIEKNKISMDANFFELGGHSLKAVILASRIHKEFNIKIRLGEIFKTPQIRKLAEYVNETAKSKFISIPLAREKKYYELSSAQKRLYYHQEMYKNTTEYNTASVVELEGDVEKENLKETFIKLSQRHETLRTSFKVVNEKPVQTIHDRVEFEIEYDEIDEKKREAADFPVTIQKMVYNFVRPFDLLQAPLWRVGLIKIGEKRYILIVDMHHIITDGTSMALFAKEFMEVYVGKELPALTLQYKDFAEWQNNEEQREVMKGQEEYWLKQFEGEIPVLNLPTDFARPPKRNFEGSSVAFELSGEDAAGLQRLALEESATLYMVLLSIYSILLARISNQEDIVIGVPSAGRVHADLEPIMGLFINILALRTLPIQSKSFREFLREVKHTALEAFENQDYQYENLVDKVIVKRDMSRNPLFDVFFTLNNIDIPEIKIPGLTLKPYMFEGGKSKYDLYLKADELDNRLTFIFEYSTTLFKKETLTVFISYFDRIIASVVKNPEVKLSEIDIGPDREKMSIPKQFIDSLENE